MGLVNLHCLPKGTRRFVLGYRRSKTGDRLFQESRHLILFLLLLRSVDSYEEDLILNKRCHPPYLLGQYEAADYSHVHKEMDIQ